MIHLCILSIFIRLAIDTSVLFQTTILAAMLTDVLLISASMLLLQTELVSCFSLFNFYHFELGFTVWKCSKLFDIVLKYNFSHAMRVIHWWLQRPLFSCALWLALRSIFVKLVKDGAIHSTKSLLRLTNPIGICAQ